MSSPSKNYKIIVDSKHFGNMKGIRIAEVAKKAASKILGIFNNKIIQFSMIEIKNGKIRNYKAFKENLIRPYKKNGKLIRCRIIVKKIGKHTGGREADFFDKLYKKKIFTEEDRTRIKAEMLINSINYEPYNLSAKINEFVSNGANVTKDLELGKNDPILYFFQKSEFNIIFDSNDVGRMKLKYIDSNSNKEKCNIFYEFTGGEDNFTLHIYNLRSCFDNLTKEEASWLVYFWEEYIKFLVRLYPRAVNFYFYYDVPSSKNRNNGVGILKVPFTSWNRKLLTKPQQNAINHVAVAFYAHFKK
jgi:hypothetical protein